MPRKAISLDAAAQLLVHQARSDELPMTVREYRAILHALDVLGVRSQASLALANAMDIADKWGMPCINGEIDPAELPWQIDRKQYPYGPGSF
jgi:hypothetical protein